MDGPRLTDLCASVAELRARFVAAVDAVVQAFMDDASRPHPASRQPSSQERAHA